MLQCNSTALNLKRVDIAKLTTVDWMHPVLATGTLGLHKICYLFNIDKLSRKYL